jgi:tetratricopeptide (TPR) repeat protein
MTYPTNHDKFMSFDKLKEKAKKLINQAGIVHALTDKGIALYNLGRYEEAIVCYDKLLEINPKDVDALYNKGVALSDLGRYGEAIVCYDKLLVINY